MTHMPYYPMMLTLAGRRCVIVGGGNVAARKIRYLIASGAEVTVVSPTLTPELRRLVQEGNVVHLEREYACGDTEGALLVFALTDCAGVNERVAADARRDGALVNLTHAPELSDFANPGVLQQGAVQIAVSTGGASPTLTRLLMHKLSILMDEGLAELAEHLLQARHEAKSSFIDAKARHQVLRRYADQCWHAHELGEPLPVWSTWIQDFNSSHR